jgi:hypothetical protein
MLGSVLKDIFWTAKTEPATRRNDGRRSVLNVGGGSKATAVPGYFDGCQHDLLDMDPRGAPELFAMRASCDSSRAAFTIPEGVSHDGCAPRGACACVQM